MKFRCCFRKLVCMITNYYEKCKNRPIIVLGEIWTLGQVSIKKRKSINWGGSWKLLWESTPMVIKKSDNHPTLVTICAQFNIIPMNLVVINIIFALLIWTMYLDLGYVCLSLLVNHTRFVQEYTKIWFKTKLYVDSKSSWSLNSRRLVIWSDTPLWEFVLAKPNCY